MCVCVQYQCSHGKYMEVRKKIVSQVSLSMIWNPEIELRLPVLVAGTLAS